MTHPRTGNPNSAVDGLLGNTKALGMLADFRDDLMHGGAFLGDEVAAFVDNAREIEAWSNQLRVACEAYVVKFFATPRAGPAHG